MKVLVCGGRDFTDRVMLIKTLNELHAITPVTELAHGAAPGADTLAGGWGIHTAFIKTTAYPANWDTGKSAGPRRNVWMYNDFKPDLVVAFPGGQGTAHMCTYAERMGTKVWRVSYLEPGNTFSARDLPPGKT